MVPQLSTPFPADEPSDPGSPAREHRLLFKSARLDRLERAIALRSPLGPHALSTCKLVVTALLFFALPHRGVVAMPLAALLFGAFALFDYLDGVVARGTGRETRFGRIYDRVTDLPMLLLVGAHSVQLVHPGWVALKFGVDLLLLALFVRGFGSTENRVRTVLSYTVLLALLFVGRGWLPELVTPRAVVNLLMASVAFSCTVALYNLRILRRAHFANLFSAANLACGVAGMVAAALGRFDLALLGLGGSVLFDGLDGAAARRWGGSRFGVLVDDVADGLSYGVMPGFALAMGVEGVTGVVMGVVYAAFVVSRLVYFTLRAKAGGDPNTFAGAPSPVGAVLVLGAMHLFGDATLTGLFVGVAMTCMVALDVRYPHLGRTMTRGRARAIAFALLALLASAAMGRAGWIPKEIPVVAIVLCTLAYAFAPTVLRFVELRR